jgi:hypothetical protein
MLVGQSKLPTQKNNWHLFTGGGVVVGANVNCARFFVHDAACSIAAGNDNFFIKIW